MAPTVVSRTNGDTRALGGLFEGLAFFLVQRLPSRSSFVEKVQTNGGRVVKLEAQADHVVADHVRKDCPPGSISFTFIDVAIRDGAVPDPSDHAAGPAVGAIRDVGSSVPGKQTRTAFTAEDDRVLWQWVERSKEQGGLVKGNDIYKQLEARNSRHTFQAWRDRYIKKLMMKPPAGVELKVAANAPPSPPEAPDQEADVRGATGKVKQKAESPMRKRTAEQQEPSARAEATGATFKLPRGSQMALQSPVKSASQKPGKQPRLPESMDDEEDSQGLASKDFEDDDYKMLLKQGKDILIVDESQYEDAWIAWAQTFPTHTAAEWQEFWEDEVRPEYMRRLKKRNAAKNRKKLEKELVAAELALKAEEARAESVTTGQHEADDVVADHATPMLETDESASSQKRKRGTPTPNATATYSQKKHRPDVSSSSEDEAAWSDQSVIEQPRQVKRPRAKQSVKSISPTKLSTQPIEILSEDESDLEDVAQETVQPQIVQEPSHDESLAEAEDTMVVDPPDPSALQVSVNQAVTSDLSSEAMRTVEQLVRGRARKPFEPERTSPQQRPNFLPTSEANRAAEQQIQRENLDIMDGDPENGTGPRQPDSDLPTSVANHAAEQQLNRESIERDHSVVEEDISPQRPTSQIAIYESNDEPIISDLLVQDGYFGSGVPAEELVDPDEGGDALTEANLASQQAQHQKQLLRGADLPEDDEMQDQTEYSSYLQQLLDKRTDAKAASPEDQATSRAHRTKEARTELPSDGPLDQTQSAHNDGQLPNDGGKAEPIIPAPTVLDLEGDNSLDQTRYTHNETDLNFGSDEPTALAVSELPLSSLQELDEVFESNLQWPISPHASQRKPKSQPVSRSLHIETQVAYPNLPFQDEEDEEDDEQMVSSQAAQPVDVAYPALPGTVLGGDEVNTGLYFSSRREEQSQPAPPQQDINNGWLEHRDDEAPEEFGDGSIHTPPTEDDDDGLPENIVTPMFNDDDAEDAEYEQEDDDIDLTIPEPEGGFGFSSSPVKSVALHALRAMAERRSPAAKAQSLFDDELEDVADALQGVTETYTEMKDDMGDADEEFEAPAAESDEAEDAGEAFEAPEVDRDEVIEVSSASSSSSLYESPVPSPAAFEEERITGKALNTQDILEAETQPLDLDMPLPPEFEDESNELPSDPLTAPSPPPQPVQPISIRKSQTAFQPLRTQQSSSTKPRPKPQQASQINLSETETLDDQGLDLYITTMTVRYKFDEAAIVEALKTTSMRPELAELVLLEEKVGRGLPVDVPGVWTEAEDKIIESGDARGMRSVTEKHGWDEMESRLKFLEQWRSG